MDSNNTVHHQHSKQKTTMSATAVTSSNVPYSSPPAVTYPDSLDPTTGHDEDFSSIASQLSSLSSLSVSQAHLNTNTSSSSDGGGSQRDIITRISDDDRVNSVATDISEWCDPPDGGTSSELNIITTKLMTGMEDEGNTHGVMEEKTHETITSVVQSRWSIMYGPEHDDESSSDDESIDGDGSSSSIDDDDEVMLDQLSSTLTTTSYSTVLAMEEQLQKEEDGKMLSSSCTELEQLTTAHNECTGDHEDGRIFQKESHTGDADSDDSQDPPISHTLSDALKDIEGAEMSEYEDEAGHYDESTKDEVSDHADSEPSMTTEENSNQEITYTYIEQERERQDDDDHTLSADIHEVNVGNPLQIESSINEVAHNAPTPCDTILSFSPNNNTKRTKQMTLATIKDHLAQDALLTSSDIALDVMGSLSSDDLLRTSSEDNSQTSSTNVEDAATLSIWEIPQHASLDEKLTFIMEKINILRYCQKSIMQQIREERKTRSAQIQECINLVKSMESSQKQESKQQRDKIELIENAVVELGRNYTGRPKGHSLLGARNSERRRSSKVSYQKAEKLNAFFGAQPPLIDQFLKDLGYEEYISRFRNERIGLNELPHIQEKNLITLGIPLGPRLRILYEAKQL